MVKLLFLILLLLPRLCFADVGGWFGQSLRQHNDVDQTTGPSNNQVLKYNSTTEQWEFNSLTDLFVPYTGATGNVDLGNYGLTATNCTLSATGTSEIPSLEVSTTLNIPHSTSLPATCAVGEIYQDTDAINLGVDLSGTFTDDIDGVTRTGTWGVTLTDVTDDYDGKTRPQGKACDIGAYEAEKSLIDKVRIRKNTININQFDNCFLTV